METIIALFTGAVMAWVSFAVGFVLATKSERSREPWQ